MLEIKAELVRRGMQQQDLADAVGMGRPVINRYLQGHTSMNMAKFFKVAGALGLPPSVLLGRAEEQNVVGWPSPSIHSLE